MYEIIEKTFRLFDLHDKEIKCYTELLNIWSQPASVLARKIWIARSTAQFTLDALVKKWFAAKLIKNQITFYSAEKIENIINMLNSQKNRYLEDFEDKEKKLKTLIPFINWLKKESVKKPKVVFYEWKNWLEMVYEDALSSTETIRSFVAFEWREQVMPWYFKDYYKKRVKNWINIKCIYKDSLIARERVKNNKSELRKSVTVDSEKYDWTPEIQFYDNKLTIASWIDKIWVIIESKEISNAMKALFDLAWIWAESLKK